MTFEKELYGSYLKVPKIKPKLKNKTINVTEYKLASTFRV
jgi:hypothetical protein